MALHTEGSVKAIFYVLGENAGIAICKFGASLYTGSNAMLAEAIHSLADCINQVFLLFGMREARRPVDVTHPMGYGRVVYFWAMMVALLLFFMGGAFSVIQGVAHLEHPEPLKNAPIAMLVLGVAFVLEALSLMGAMKEIRKIAKGKPFFRWFRETRQSELMVAIQAKMTLQQTDTALIEASIQARWPQIKWCFFSRTSLRTKNN